MSTSGTGPTTPSSPADPTKVQNQDDYIELLIKSARQQEILNKLEKERSEMLNKSSEALEGQLRTQNSMINSLMATIPKVEEIKKLQDQIDAIEEKKKGYLEIQNEAFKMLVESMGEAEATEERLLEIQKEQLATLDEQIRAKQAEQDVTKQAREDFINSLVVENKLYQQLKHIRKDGVQKNLIDRLKAAKNEQEIREIMLEEKANNEEMLKLQEKMSSHASKFAKKLGMSSDISDTTLGQFMEMQKRMEQMSGAGFKVREALQKAVSESFNFKKLLADVVEEIKKMVVQLDKVGKKLAADTGMGNVYNFQSQIMRTYGTTVSGGATMEEASSAIKSLATGFSKFNPTANAVNSSLATTVVNLQKIGVDGASAVKTMDFFSRTLRMTEKESANLTTELALMGQSMGMTSSKIISDFQSVSNDLAIYGKSAIGVFKDLEAQAKATGMEISSLVGIAKQFDTFDSAADKAAQLNAVLGTQLSALELMNMKYDDRVNYIRQEVSFAAGNLDSLDQYTQQFIAQAMGVSSVAEAQKLLNMSQGEYLSYQSDMANAKNTQEELSQITQDLVPVMQKLELVFKKLVLVLSPLITALSLVFNILGSILNPIFKLLDGLMNVVNYSPLFTNSLMAIAAVLAIVKFEVLKLNLGMGWWLVVGLVVLGIIEQFAPAYSGLALGIMAAGAALYFLNGAAYQWHVVALLLIAAFGTQINPLFVQAFAFMAVGIIAMAFALKFMKGQAMLAAIVLALLAGAVALVFYGIAAMAESLNSLIVTLVESGVGLFMAANGLYAIAGGIMAIAMSMYMLGPLGVLGLIGMAVTLNSIGIGFEKIAGGLDKITKISTALSNLGSNGLLAITSEGNKISAVMGTGDVLNNFNAGKLEVEVKMPKMETPKIELKVELMGRQLEAFIKEVVAK